MGRVGRREGTCVDPGGTIGDTQVLGLQDGNLR